DVSGALRDGAAPDHRGGPAPRRDGELTRGETALPSSSSRHACLRPTGSYPRAMTTPGTGGPVDFTIRAPDGLRLHVRRYGAPSDATLPVLCLPGLARTAEDFAEVAHGLTTDTADPRCVFAMDYRGRGNSEYDRDSANYSLPVEVADVLAVMTALELSPAIVVGTSRGGLLAMLLAALRPGAVAGVVLNDIGPVIEPQGLMRIKSYVGKLP